MTASPRRSLRLVAASLLLVVLAACGTQPAPAAPAPQPSGQPAATPAAQPAKSKFKMAMILPGTVQDADYNFAGHEALQKVGKDNNMDVKFQEKVDPADAERVARGFINDGYNIIAFHGGQFVTVVGKLAPQFSDVVFIQESSGARPDLPANVWNIGRKFYQGFYSLGVLAALSTQSKKIGVIAGAKLPDFVASINAIKAAVKANNPQAQVIYAFDGDQNDPLKARQAAEAQLSQGVDFIILIVNLGAYGVVEAVKDKPVLLTTYYTDKTNLAPKNFAGSLLTDFGMVYGNVIDQINKGTKGGYLEMRPGSGFALSKLANVPDAVAAKVAAIAQQVEKKELTIEEKTDGIPD